VSIFGANYGGLEQTMELLEFLGYALIVFDFSFLLTDLDGFNIFKQLRFDWLFDLVDF